MTTIAQTSITPAAGVVSKPMLVANEIFDALSKGRNFSPNDLSHAMTRAYGASDAKGAWDWKDAYDAGEIATVMFVAKFGRAMLARSASPHTMLAMVQKNRGPVANTHETLGRNASVTTTLDAG
jgi:hypothetical protein